MKSFVYTPNKIVCPSLLNSVFTFAMFCLLAASVHAETDLVVDGDFDGTTTTLNIVMRKHHGDGWMAKTPTNTMASDKRWIISEGAAVANDGTWEIVQVNSISDQSGPKLYFGFTWKAPSGATEDYDLSLNFALVGWHSDDRTDVDGSENDRSFLNVHQGPGIGVRSGGANSNAIGRAVDLTGGDPQYSGTTVIGTAGTANTYTFEYDIPEFGDGNNDLSDYDHIGIAFWRHSAEDEDLTSGGTLDNVQLDTSPIPEPASFAFVLVGSLLAFCLRRRCNFR